uniref:Uncharacterized protein n=1 Tax=Arundo donax TaxID=35708 RepID=A0A0A9C5D5_ARUDO
MNSPSPQSPRVNSARADEQHPPRAFLSPRVNNALEVGEQYP